MVELVGVDESIKFEGRDRVDIDSQGLKLHKILWGSNGTLNYLVADTR
jgi:hypothetical protein